MKIYVYILTDPRKSNRMYVGVSVNPKVRYQEHLRTKGDYYNSKWIQSLVRDGLRPIMQIIDETDENGWSGKERYWIKYYRDEGFELTNSTDGGDGLYIPCEETRQKLSAVHKGKPIPPDVIARRVEQRTGKPHPHKPQVMGKEACENMSKSAKKRVAEIGAPMKGKNHSEETRQKLRIARTGTKRSPESIEKQRVAMSGENNPNFGKPMSQETKEKLRIANMGRPAPNKGKSPSAETRAKIGAAHLGMKHTDEAKKRVGDFWRGRPKSPEQIAKMRESALRNVYGDDWESHLKKN